MTLLKIQTLIDITNTNVRRANQGSPLELNQFRNWITLLQCLGLRSIIEYDENPICEKQNINKLGFGSTYTGSHNVWTCYFKPDREDSFFNDENIDLLKNDIDRVPIVINLQETINIAIAAFIVNDNLFANTTVEVVD